MASTPSQPRPSQFHIRAREATTHERAGHSSSFDRVYTQFCRGNVTECDISMLKSTMNPLTQADSSRHPQHRKDAAAMPRGSLSPDRTVSLKRPRDENTASAPLKKPRSDAAVGPGPSLAPGSLDRGAAVQTDSSNFRAPAFPSSSVAGSILSNFPNPRSSFPCGLSPSPAPIKVDSEDMSPDAFVELVFAGEGDSSSEPARRIRPLEDADFLPITEEQIAAYSFEAVAAVRNSDVGALERLHGEGHNLRCCNRFGESILHAACRRASGAAVRFLLEEAGVSPRIKDDYGRTPLHDACWRGRPDLEVVELLLRKEPRLALVRDVRGHRPFQYARREHWRLWREFLGRRRDLLVNGEVTGSMVEMPESQTTRESVCEETQAAVACKGSTEGC